MLTVTIKIATTTKNKNEEKRRNKIFLPCTDQKQFWPFLERKKNIKQILVSNFLSGNCPLNHRITYQESGELSVDTH